MEINESAERLRKMINKAIEDHQISHKEYEQIIHIATEDWYIDAQEKSLLKELQNLIEKKIVKFKPKDN